MNHAPRRPRVAFQGEHGAYGEEAIRAHFGAEAEAVPCRSFTEVAAAVQSGRVSFGVLPLENSIVGEVSAARAALDASPLTVLSRIAVPIRHCLLGLPGTGIDAIRSVRSHPVALAQCSRYLGALPGVVSYPAYDTAGAAREVALAGDRTRAAVASATAALLYSLKILATDIADREENVTVFGVVESSGVTK